jgi:predicted AAA+ superfamily ATPase
MKRKVIEKLIEWKESDKRKPLLLKGARQTGKTYSLEKFGKDFFPACYCFDFMKNPEYSSIFERNLSPRRIIQELSVIIDSDINLKEDLIIFDEIQESPKALTSLKYFAQEYPNAYICASGSLLGIFLHDTSSFPVGKVDRCNLYPMDFDEFLLAMNQERLLNLIKTASFENPISSLLHDKIWEYYKYFMITGGLPEVVKTFRDNFKTINQAFKKVRALQHELSESYIDDISKHSGKIKAVKIQAVLKSIPVQLARENKGVDKFVFKNVLANASRYSTLEAPIEWLIKAGLVIKVPISSKAEFPLQGYSDKKRFKLYLFDVGILGSMLNLSPKTIFNYDYGSYKGYFAENIILTEMTARLEQSIYSWSRNTSEIEFLLEVDEDIIPIEVKAGINTKAKSLKVFKNLYDPKHCFVFSGNPMNISNNEYLPLYMAGELERFLK